MREVIFDFFDRKTIFDQNLIFFRIAIDVIDNNDVIAEKMIVENIANDVNDVVIDTFDVENVYFFFCYVSQLFSLLRLSRKFCENDKCVENVQFFQRLNLRCRLCENISTRVKTIVKSFRESNQSKILKI